MKLTFGIFWCLLLVLVQAENPIPKAGETLENQKKQKEAEVNKTKPKPAKDTPDTSEPNYVNESERTDREPPVSRKRRRRSRLSAEEKNFIEKHKGTQKKYSSKQSSIALPPGKALKKSNITENMKLEVVDEPIQNVFRLISKSYKINIVPKSDLSDLRITIHLEDIPVREGIRVICQANQLEMSEARGVIYINKASEKAIAEMNMSSKKIDINVENKPVKDFIKEFSKKRVSVLHQIRILKAKLQDTLKASSL